MPENIVFEALLKQANLRETFIMFFILYLYYNIHFLPFSKQCVKDAAVLHFRTYFLSGNFIHLKYKR